MADDESQSRSPLYFEEEISRLVVETVGIIHDSGVSCGRVRTAEALRGKPSSYVLSCGLDALPAFGALGFLTSREVVTIIDDLESSGFLTRWYRDCALDRPRLMPTPAGRELASGAVRHRARLPWNLKGVRLPEHDPGLLTALRSLRSRLSREAGAPAYYVLTDNQLLLTAAAAPESLDELKHVRGWGPDRIERYGAAFLECISEFLGQRPADDSPELGDRAAVGSLLALAMPEKLRSCASGQGVVLVFSTCGRGSEETFPQALLVFGEEKQAAHFLVYGVAEMLHESSDEYASTYLENHVATQPDELLCFALLDAFTMTSLEDPQVVLDKVRVLGVDVDEVLDTHDAVLEDLDWSEEDDPFPDVDDLYDELYGASDGYDPDAIRERRDRVMEELRRQLLALHPSWDFPQIVQGCNCDLPTVLEEADYGLYARGWSVSRLTAAEVQELAALAADDRVGVLWVEGSGMGQLQAVFRSGQSGAGE